MTVSELIKELKGMPQDMNVHIFDYRKNLFNGGGEPSSDGVQDITGVAVVPDDAEVKDTEEVYDEKVIQWVAIDYTNDDYTDDETPADNTHIAGYFEEKFSK